MWWFLARGLSSTSIAATRMDMQLLEPHLTDLNVLVFLIRSVREFCGNTIQYYSGKTQG